MTKQIGLALMIISLVFVFTGFALAPSWLVQSTLGDLLFTVLVILILIGIMIMLK